MARGRVKSMNLAGNYRYIQTTTKCDISALKSSLKTSKRLQLDWTKTAEDWTCSLGLSVLRLEDHKKTGCGGPVLLVETGLLYFYNYPSKCIQDYLFKTKTDEDILKTVKYFMQMVDVPEWFYMYLNSQHNFMFLHSFESYKA